MPLLRPASPRPRRRAAPVVSSLLAHIALGALLLLAPALREDTVPRPPSGQLPVLYFDPPAPPPLPPVRGTAAGRRELRPHQREVRAVEPERVELLDTFAAWRRQILDFAPEPDETPWGAEDGDDDGVPEGMPGGNRLGQIGGLPGGVPGGEPGAAGRGPVRDYDRAPRLLRRTQPVYPQEAFRRRIEGTVLLELVIGATGIVEDVRVLRSVPGLDAAAVACVRQWLFEPGRRRGRPVPTLARAPITFTIR